jgi:hypothetical protein
MSNFVPQVIQTEIEKHDQVEIPIEHFFSDGVYARHMTVQEDGIVVGKVHKHNHLAILLEGTVRVSSKYGTALYSAPYVINVNKGDKRAFYAVTKVKYITVHATEETDLDKLEQELVE